MKFTEIKDKEKSELEKMLKDKKNELFELRLQLKTMQLTNTSKISLVRKTSLESIQQYLPKRTKQ